MFVALFVIWVEVMRTVPKVHAKKFIGMAVKTNKNRSATGHHQCSWGRKLIQIMPAGYVALESCATGSNSGPNRLLTDGTRKGGTTEVGPNICG